MIGVQVIREPIVQVNDKTRIDLRKSFSSLSESFTVATIDFGAGPIDVLSKMYLDWLFNAPNANQTIDVHLETATDSADLQVSMVVISEADDKLFSSDDDLMVHEPDIMDWVRPGRASFKNIHRMVQTKILDWLNGKKFRMTNGDRITKDAIVDVADVREWATYWALQLIFEGRSNAIDDVFAQKADEYSQKKISHREEFIGLDLVSDNVTEVTHRATTTSFKVGLG